MAATKMFKKCLTIKANNDEENPTLCTAKSLIDLNQILNKSKTLYILTSPIVSFARTIPTDCCAMLLNFVDVSREMHSRMHLAR